MRARARDKSASARVMNQDYDVVDGQNRSRFVPARSMLMSFGFARALAAAARAPDELTRVNVVHSRRARASISRGARTLPLVTFAANRARADYDECRMPASHPSKHARAPDYYAM